MGQDPNLVYPVTITPSKKIIKAEGADVPLARERQDRRIKIGGTLAHPSISAPSRFGGSRTNCLEHTG